MFLRSFMHVYELDDDDVCCRHDEMWFMKHFLHTFKESVRYVGV